jgi:hypothetical protein
MHERFHEKRRKVSETKQRDRIDELMAPKTPFKKLDEYILNNETSVPQPIIAQQPAQNQQTASATKT